MITKHEGVLIIRSAVSTRGIKLKLYHNDLEFSTGCYFDDINMADFSKQAHHRLDALLHAMEAAEADSTAKDNKGKAV